MTYLNNILVMEYIGTGEGAAPMLRNVEVENPEECFDILVDSMIRLYQEGRLVHGDLSEYNVLIPDDDLVIIDVGQSVVLDHPMSHELLERDIKNMIKYFSRYGVAADSTEIIENITGTTREDTDEESPDENENE
jgi:RIO kinase 1